MNFKASKPDARILILQIIAAGILSFYFKSQWATFCFFFVIDFLILFLYGAKVFLQRLIAYVCLNALTWGLLIVEIPVLSVVLLSFLMMIVRVFPIYLLLKLLFAYDGNIFSIHDIDLTIQEGEFIVLTGKSGCGKTTLTRCINGLIPDFFEGTIAGSCQVCDMDISEHETGDYSAYVGSVFQDPRSQFFTLHVKTEIPFPSENFSNAATNHSMLCRMWIISF